MSTRDRAALVGLYLSERDKARRELAEYRTRFYRAQALADALDSVLIEVHAPLSDSMHPELQRLVEAAHSAAMNERASVVKTIADNDSIEPAARLLFRTFRIEAGLPRGDGGV